MIDAGVEGRYIFTVGEESGGIGSSALAGHWLERMDFAVGFDRKGYDSVITHQGGSRTCPEKFAEALADELGMTPDPTGVFTDTALWAGEVQCCTNISVGYFGAHTTKEKVNAHWLDNALIPLLVDLDWSALPITEREKDDHWDDVWWGQADDEFCVTDRGEGELYDIFEDEGCRFP